jgi:23S rRNA (guanosine2251-2'-O)-methyltransferase
MIVIRECSNPQCQFRYPDQDSEHIKAYCPKCGHEALIQEKINNPEPQTTITKPSNAFVRPLRAVLDNIRSIYNVGSIFRTSDGFGVEELVLCGITPTPENPRFKKTSLGAENILRWSYHLNAVNACRNLHDSGFQIIALENPSESKNLYELDINIFKKPVALVVGNEKTGVDPQILRISDLIVSIPMSGSKNSFNVATAYGIAVSAFYALLQKSSHKDLDKARKSSSG